MFAIDQLSWSLEFSARVFRLAKAMLIMADSTLPLGSSTHSSNQLVCQEETIRRALTDAESDHSMVNKITLFILIDESKLFN